MCAAYFAVRKGQTIETLHIDAYIKNLCMPLHPLYSIEGMHVSSRLRGHLFLECIEIHLDLAFDPVIIIGRRAFQATIHDYDLSIDKAGTVRAEP